MKTAVVSFERRGLALLRLLRIKSKRRTYAHVVRDALALYGWCHERAREGYAICAIDPTTRAPIREVVLPFSTNTESPS